MDSKSDVEGYIWKKNTILNMWICSRNKVKPLIGQATANETFAHRFSFTVFKWLGAIAIECLTDFDCLDEYKELYELHHIKLNERENESYFISFRCFFSRDISATHRYSKDCWYMVHIILYFHYLHLQCWLIEWLMINFKRRMRYQRKRNLKHLRIKWSEC